MKIASTMPDHSLPLLCVFQHMGLKERSRTALVCKEWCRILQHPSLWTELDLSNWQNPQPVFDVLDSIPAAKEALTRVNLEFTVGIEDRHLDMLSQFLLTAVNLNGCQKLTDAGIARFLMACPNLESLSLYWNLNAGSQTMAAISKSGSHLTSLNLSGCKSITDSGVQRVAAACTSLQQLDLTRCVKLGDAAYLAIAQHCTGLQELRLYASLPSVRAIQAFSALKHLQLLDICGAHQATDEAIAAVAEGCSLHHINLTWCVQLTDAAVVALAKGCPDLELLSLHGIRGITDAGIDALKEHNSSTLHTLDITGCTGVSRYPRQELAHAFPNVRCFLWHK